MGPVDPVAEAARLDALKKLGILDTPPEAGFDTLVSLVSSLLDVPMALVSLVDAERQWFKAKIGIDAQETHRDYAFCDHAIKQDGVFVIEDASKDWRFSHNPLVTGAPFIRAYAGAPIIVEDGVRIGTLCALDRQARTFSPDQQETLVRMAQLVAGRMKLLAIAAEADARSELLLEASRLSQRAQVVLGVMSDGVIVQDRNGAIVSANDSAATVLGLTLDQLMGRTSIDPRWRSVHEDGSPLPGSQHPSMVTLATGKPINNLTVGVEQPNGIRRWLRASSRPLFEDGGDSPSHAVVTFSDITEIVEKTQALQLAHEQAKMASQAKSAFLANVSHEIRTPLNGVIGLASVLGKTALSATQSDMVDLIKTSGETLERLLSDILDGAKLDAGKLEVRMAPMNLHDAVNASAQLIGLRADEKGIKFDVKLGPNTDGLIMGDSIRLRQIISNLTSNALKFTEKGTISVAVSVEDKENGSDEASLKLVVSDTGMGFSRDTAKRLFSRFEQADSSITRAFGGTGLGLSICRSLVELMEGTISATSLPGVGSVFTVILPTKRVAASPEEKQTTPIQSETLQGGVQGSGDRHDEEDSPLRVLMAEDHPINQRVTSLCLEPWGAEITIAVNGVEAVDFFKRAHFDIVLMDMQMPAMDGLEATRQIRLFESQSNRPRTPIAMLSANAMEEHVAMALAAGCDHHIAKPVTPDALGKGMEEAFRLASLHGENKGEMLARQA
jgi:two-component system, sensor histidine kinase